MNRLIPLLVLSLLVPSAGAAGPAPVRDRLVWVFGWDLEKASDVPEIIRVLDAAGAHGLNGAVLPLGLDTLCKKPPEYFERLERVRAACERNHLEVIPSVFAIGYAGGIYAHDRNLMEGLPVEDAPFVVRRGVATLASDAPAGIANGTFEEHRGDRFAGFHFHDQPGEVSFADARVHHGGRTSIRFENLAANPHGHGRIEQDVALRPGRCYRLSLWVKTEGLEPANSFRVAVLAKDKDRELAPLAFNTPSTSDWRKVSFLFNSRGEASARIYAGTWGGKRGKFWLDDWTLEEVGPINVLRRPGTPVTVRSTDGTTYDEGRDYETLADPDFHPARVDRPAPALKIPRGSRIEDGARLRVSWYHSQMVNDWQHSACMAEPAVYEIFDHEAKLLAQHLHPRRVLLSMDEIREGGTCKACEGRNMGELLGECITRQVRILREHIPGVEVMAWSDMLDPGHNARGDYYLVSGDFNGSWNHVPKDLIMVPWGGEPRAKSVAFFSGLGFRSVGACYYDADDLDEVRAWLDLARKEPKLQGLMYTPWTRKYELLGAFGDLLRTH
ncbi:Carbohydrate binding domain protein [Aquisphaera giovannonii]|uniref:Carbohydrate binding domain protein n=1 Tax=Aquisphaera giovannonii TaxID=406548 RepID=A0A5B9W3X3_9BACT|nr:carbohydrate binding domain-containing protein [Aquisphaera giovannonii]QEH35316.1 Carbohydrate binding domain protein [Aquisphaera giovannonii]